MGITVVPEQWFDNCYVKSTQAYSTVMFVVIGISKQRLDHIIHEILQIKKICARFATLRLSQIVIQQIN